MISHLLLLLLLVFIPNTHSFRSSNVKVIRSYVSLSTDDDIEIDIPSAPLQQMTVGFDCNLIDPEELSELMFELGTLSVSVEVDKMDRSFLNDESRWGDLQKLKSWSTAVLKTIFPSSFDVTALSEILCATYPEIDFKIEVKDVENKDWISHVQQGWPPQIIGDLTIKFPWHEEIEQTTSQILTLEGGAAFGTGDHPTTRLCCRWLDRVIHQIVDGNSSTPPVSLSVLDYGCGSAILGLAALRYGATEAVGVDIDKDALVSARNNCQLNHLDMELYFASGDSDGMGDEEKSVAMSAMRGIGSHFQPLADLKISRQFDIVVANILAPILLQLAPSLALKTKPGGWIGLSGIWGPQSDSIIKRYKEYFSEVVVEDTEEEWVLVTARK